MKQTNHNYNNYPNGFNKDELKEELLKYINFDARVVFINDYCYYIVCKQHGKDYFITKNNTYPIKDFISGIGIYRYIEFDNTLLFL